MNGTQGIFFTEQMILLMDVISTKLGQEDQLNQVLQLTDFSTYVFAVLIFAERALGVSLSFPLWIPC